MRRPTEGRFPIYSPKRPPPAQGIKAKQAGVTWWGQRWIEALERVLRADSGRLARGRTYARAGRAHDLAVRAGTVTARVTGSRDPYAVVIELPLLSDATWQAAIAAMAQKSEFSALLLNSQMPRQIDEAFLSEDASLFPRTRAELKTSCDCPDYGDPCKHVAAVHYVLGDALDRDPFLLFELRGRTREQVLGALRAIRAGASPTDDPDAARAPFDEPPSVALESLTARSYDAAPAPLPSLTFSFEPPLVHAAALRQLGAPGSWNHDSPPVEAFTPLLRSAAEAARRLALDDVPSAPPAEAPTPKPRKTRRPKT
jgi:uncharacterized Zn finger protein